MKAGFMEERTERRRRFNRAVIDARQNEGTNGEANEGFGVPSTVTQDMISLEAVHEHQRPQRRSPTEATQDGGSIGEGGGNCTEEPEGFSLKLNAVPEEAWAEIRTWLGLDQLCGASLSSGVRVKRTGGADGGSHASIPWEVSPSTQHRRVAQFGSCRYDYAKNLVLVSTSDDPVPPIPSLLRRLLLNSATLKDADCPPDSESFTQCIVNVYERGEVEIPWHMDDNRFGPLVLVFCFGEARPLLMRLPETKATGADRAREWEKGGAEVPVKLLGTFTAKPDHLSRYILRGPAREFWEHSVPAGEGWRVSITFRTLRATIS